MQDIVSLCSFEGSWASISTAWKRPPKVKVSTQTTNFGCPSKFTTGYITSYPIIFFDTLRIGLSVYYFADIYYKTGTIWKGSIRKYTIPMYTCLGLGGFQESLPLPTFTTRLVLDLFRMIFYGLYHGKPPVNHHLGAYFWFTFSIRIQESQIQDFRTVLPFEFFWMIHSSQ